MGFLTRLFDNLSSEGRGCMAGLRNEPDVRRVDMSTGQFECTIVTMYDAVREIQFDRRQSAGDSWAAHLNDIRTGKGCLIGKNVFFQMLESGG